MFVCLRYKVILEATFQLSCSQINRILSISIGNCCYYHSFSKFTQLLQLFDSAVDVHHEVYVLAHLQFGFLLLKLALIHISLDILQNHPRFLSVYV